MFGIVKSVCELVQMDILLFDGWCICLLDVVDVCDMVVELCQMVLFDGKLVVSFQVFCLCGVSEILVVKGVCEVLGVLQVEWFNVYVIEVYNMVKLVLDVYIVLMYVLYEGVILVVIVVWLFLCDWWVMFVLVVVLLLLIILIFVVMQLLDFMFNGIMLLVFIFVVGIFVDDVIVEVENIVCYLCNGKKLLEVVMEVVQEIGLVVVVILFMLVVVFLLMVFMGGILGKFFKQFGWMVLFVVLVLLLVVWLFMFMMVVYMFKLQDELNCDGWIMMCYLQVVCWCFVYLWKMGGMVVVFFVVLVVIIGLIFVMFLLFEDWVQFQMMVESLFGSIIVQMCDNIECVCKIVMQYKEVCYVYMVIGLGVMVGVLGFSGGEVCIGIFMILFIDWYDWYIKQQDV